MFNDSLVKGHWVVQFMLTNPTPLCGRLILVITGPGMITDQIGLHSVLLPS